MIKATIEQIKDPNYLQNKSFNRLRSALKSVDKIEDSVAYNVVDSVIFIKNPKYLEEESGYKAIYNTVVINEENEDIEVEIGAKVSNLQNYDDTQDFGLAEVNDIHVIKPNEVLIIETMEPYRIKSSAHMTIAYVSKYSGIK